MHGFELLLLGLVIGLLTLLPPGPVNVALLEVGAAHGRRTGVRAGLGVVTGDVVLACAATALLGVGAALPPVVLSVTAVISAATLVAMGSMLLVRPHAVSAVAVRLQRPYLSMFAITAFTPSAFGAWVALLGAMPFAGQPFAMALFSGGVMVASLGWHVGLGGLAGTFGGSLSSAKRGWFARLGGVAMLAFAVWSLAGR